MSKEVKKTSQMPEKATELPMDSKKEVVTTEAPTKEEMPVETKTAESETVKKMEETAKAEVAEMPKKVAETPEMTPAPKGESPVAKEEMVTSPDQVKKAVTDNIKDSTEVPASYLEKANVPGPFLAGVNQVIPYEAFGGDGMLTRLLLKAADKAPWSDNGTAGNVAILPLEGLAKGQYFYEVDLNGNTRGKEGQALLDQLRANGTQTYKATVKVYGAKDGKPDLTNVVATRQIMVQLHGKDMTTKSSQDNQAGMDAEKDNFTRG
ncbi:SSURE domain-containing protein [Streptococcus sp. Z554]